MKPRIQILRSGHLPVDLVKIVVCAIIFTHGVHRYMSGVEIPALGQFLTQSGFPFGLVLAHLVNVAETFGTVLIVLGLFVRSMCAVMILIFVTGIALVHRHYGFFIIGPGEGGWEFSALLIASFLAVALDYVPNWPAASR